MRPPVFYGQFLLKILVAVQSRFYCTMIQYFLLQFKTHKGLQQEKYKSYYKGELKVNSLFFNIFRKSTNQICSPYEYLSFYCLQRVHFCLRPQRKISHIVGGSTYKILRRTPPPRHGTQFFRFHIHFHRKVSMLEVHVSPNGSTPPLTGIPRSAHCCF